MSEAHRAIQPVAYPCAPPPWANLAINRKCTGCGACCLQQCAGLFPEEVWRQNWAVGPGVTFTSNGDPSIPPGLSLPYLCNGRKISKDPFG